MKMNTTDNKKKRYWLIAILLLLALFLGIEKCTEKRKNKIHKAPLPEQIKGECHGPDAVKTSFYVRSHVRYVKRRNVMPFMRSARHDRTIPVEDIHEPLCPPSVHESSEPPSLPKEVPEVRQDGKKAAIVKPSEEYPHCHLFRLGIHAGIGYSHIIGLESVIENYDVRPQFTMQESGGVSPLIGVFSTWQYSRFGAELDLDYARYRSQLTEYKTVSKITEKTTFHYDVLTPQLMIRMYVFHGLYMGAGAGLSIPLGGSNIEFASDRNGTVYQQQSILTEKHMRSSIKSRMLLMPAVKLGYVNVHTGLELGLEYSYGATDFLHTVANDYSYKEHDNYVQFINFIVGYSIPLNKDKK